MPGRKINKTSNQLHIDDIEGTRPKATEFKTNRMVNPLCPQYLLPSVNEIAVDKGRNFVRDTLQISDINAKRRQILRERGIEALREPIPGS